MTPRQRVTAALTFQPVDRIPRQLWALPGVPRLRSEEYNRLISSFEWDFAGPAVRYGASRYTQGEGFTVGENTDEFGTTWTVLEEGVLGEVRRPRFASWEDAEGYELPHELLDEADFSRVDASCDATDRFVLAGTFVRPFERAQFLRGSENLYMDLATDEPGLRRFLDRLHALSMREMEMWAKTKVDGVSFMDDWGSQTALLISPAMWRRVFKPYYKDYCDVLKKAGKFIFFHSDGFIEAIYPDLIELGVNAVNSQLFSMDIEKLGREYGGKIAFWGEMDRQRLLPFGTPEEVRAGVRRVKSALMQPNGSGVIAQCEWGMKDPYENVCAVYEEWGR